MADVGLDGLLYINTGTTASPTWTLIAGQKNASFSFKKATVDITCKDNSGWEDFIGTTRGWTVSADGLVEEADDGFLYLEDAFFDDATREFKFITPVGREFEGEGEIETLDEKFPYDNVIEYSLTVKGKGALTKTGV